MQKAKLKPKSGTLNVKARLYILIGIHFMQGWTSTMRDWVTKKTHKNVKKELTVRMCLLIRDLKPFKS